MSSRPSLVIDCCTISDYRRNFLKEQFLSAVGRTWIDRDAAMQTVARHLGFARTGKVIQKELRSIINGLLRTGHLERDGDRIRVLRSWREQ